MARTKSTSECTRKPASEGRSVWLPGRGRTFVHQYTGPRGAPTVVLLHGWTSTADLNWAESFEALARHFNVIALDHRGHGRGIRRDTPFRLVDCADDVAALVRQLDCGPVIPVGYSMGGPIAQLFCQRHPELVNGVVFCATSCTFRDTFREDVLFSLLAGTKALASALPLAALTTAAVGVWGRLNALRGRASRSLDQVVRHDWNSIVEAGREVGRFDSRSWVSEINVPAAIVMTDQDTVVPPERQLLLVDRLRDLVLLHVDGDHGVCGTDPDTFVPALVEACLSVCERVDDEDDLPRAA